MTDLVGLPGAAERFQREARIAAAFSHPNVVTVHDYGVSGGHAFLVMELLEGRTLRELLRAEERIERQRALAILRDVTAAVEAAHRRQLVASRSEAGEHLPRVSLGSGESAKVLDFGIAKFLTPKDGELLMTHTTGGALLGTPWYMAPEQLRGEDPDPSWDLWALAVIAFEMLSGSHPFASMALAHDLARGEPAADRRLANLPPACREFLARGLALDRAARPRVGRQSFSPSSSGACMADGGFPGAARPAGSRRPAGASSSPPGRSRIARSADALTGLCEMYWYPVYAFIRRQGYRAEECADLTQEFFARVLEKNYFHDADPARGRFRAFLCASIRHFLSNERDRARTLKRGGTSPPISLDVETAEGTYRLEPRDDLTPEKLFDRRWALILLERVLARLRDQHAAAGKGELFDRLKGFLTGDSAGQPYAEVARALGDDRGSGQGRRASSAAQFSRHADTGDCGDRLRTRRHRRRD